MLGARTLPCDLGLGGDSGQKRQWHPTPGFLPGKSMDGGAWGAAVCGVTQSRTRLKRLSSSKDGGILLNYTILILFV